MTQGSGSEGIAQPASTSAATGLADRQTAWELGASQPLGAGLTVYGRFGRSFRLANVDEFSFTSPGVDLLAQRSHDLELGSRLAYAGGKVELRLYRSNLRNEIGFDPDVEAPLGVAAEDLGKDQSDRQQRRRTPGGGRKREACGQRERPSLSHRRRPLPGPCSHGRAG